MNITQDLNNLQNMNNPVYFIEDSRGAWLKNNHSEFYSYEITTDPMEAEFFYNRDNAEEFLEACQADGYCKGCKVTEHLFVSPN